MHERTPKTNALRKQGFSSITKFLIILAVLATGGILMSRFGAFAGTITNISMRPVNLTTGLAAHWTFDGNLQNAADSSGNGNTGYFANFGATTTIPGKIGQALKFTGANPYIRIPPNASVELGTTMSIGFWIKRNPLFALSSYDSYIQKTDFSTSGWAIQGNDTTADMYIRVDTSAGAAQTPCFGMSNMLDGSWHHLVIVLDASQPTGTCRSYVDGVASVSGTFNSGTGFNNPANEFLMRGGGGSGGATVGGIDDVRLYNRLLSAKEAQQLYQLGGNGTKAGVTQAIPPVPNASSSPVAYWTFNGRDTVTGQVNDLSGNNYHGSEKNMSTSTAYAPGRIGQALRFDGVDDRVIIPWLMPGPLGVVNHSSFTIVAWVYPEWNSTAAENTIISQQDGTGNGRFLINIDLPQGLGCTVPAEFVSFLGGAVSCSNISAIKGEWQQVALVVREAGASDTVSFYVNGVFGKTTTQNIGTNDSAGWVIGDKKTFLAPFQGRLDDIRIYDRELSQAELKQLYDSGAPTKAAATQAPPRLADANSGLVGHWTFDGKKLLQNAADSSAQGNTAYLSGFTSTTTIPGKIGQALSFDGAGTYVSTVSNPASLQLDVGTLSAWIRTKNAGGSYRGIITKSLAYGIYLQSNVFIFYDNGTPAARSTGVNLADGRWHHVAATFQSGVSNGTILYIDGVQSLVTTITNTSQGSAIRIGMGQGGASQTFRGDIDDPRIYNRLLSADEIKQLYDLGR